MGGSGPGIAHTWQCINVMYICNVYVRAYMGVYMTYVYVSIYIMYI